jgi:hypothetical protein
MRLYSMNKCLTQQVKTHDKAVKTHDNASCASYKDP